MKPKFLLDLGGSFFGELAAPFFSDEFDSNSFLYTAQQDLLKYLEARLAFICLVKQVGGNLASIPWYRDVKYDLYWNNVESGLFIGHKVQKYASFENYPMDFVLRIDICGSTEDRITLGTTEEHIDLAVKLAECFGLWEERGITVPPITIFTPKLHSESIDEKCLYKDLRLLMLDKMIPIVLHLGLRDDGDLKKVLNRSSDCLVGWISEVFDTMGEICQ